jgi:Domain of unknown function (DUF5666)
MRVRFTAILILCTILGGAAFAHGDKKHIMGTLEKISASSVTVKTRDGKSVDVKLTADTTYLEHKGKADNPARFSDLTVGDMVVIHASPKGETLEADEIKFSAPAAAGTAATPAPKP